MTDAGCTWTWRPSRPVDLHATLGVLGRGRGDPAFVTGRDGVWWATRAEGLPVTLHLTTDARAGVVRAVAWGDTAEAVLPALPRMLGSDDDVTDFVAHHDVVARAWRQHAGWRVPCTGRVFEALAPAVLEQKVTGGEARSSWRSLVSRFGEPAPGPTPRPMVVPPTPKQWAAIPEWEWYDAGVTPQRRRTLVRAASVGGRLDAAASLPADAAGRLMREVPGIGVWTQAEVRQRAFGDPDTVSVGDFHLAMQISWALTGERGNRGDDERMLELLEPYRGHRYRVQRLLELAGVSAPRRGPRYAPPPHRRVATPR
jgi:3-methyladenine DNA glycosylase/8-oxoguanine DNA glycosylase